MKNMKKLNVFFAGLAVASMMSCASSEDWGLAVGKVFNTECSNRTRTGITSMMKLMKDGDNISCELTDYPVKCEHGDIDVSCKHNGFNLDITLDQNMGEGTLGTNCTCRINIYFTVYGATEDSYHVTLGNLDVGDVSFKGHSSVLVNLATLEQKYVDE